MSRSALLGWAPHLIAATYLAGVATAAVVGGHPASGLIGALMCLGVAGLAASRGRAALSVALLWGGVAALGWGWGALRIDVTAVHPLTQTRTVVLVGVVETTPSVLGDRLRSRLRVRQVVVPSGLAVTRARVLLDTDRAEAGLRPGQIVRVTGRLGPPSREDAPQWWRRYLERQMIAGRLVARSVDHLGSRGGVQGLRDRLRNALTSAAGRGLSGDRATLVRGMALGGGGELTPETADTMRDAGIWHLLAVSGQNIAIVANGLCALLIGVGVARRGAVAGGVVAVVLYCLACDGGASVARAAIVALLGLTGELLDRARDRGYLLIVGAAVLVGIQPRSLFDPGLHLSFAAVAGLMVIAPPLQIWFGGFVPRPVAALAAFSLAASLATAPVTIAHFGVVSLVGVAVNMAVGPLAPVVVVSALVGAVAGAVASPLGVVPTFVAGVGVELIRVIATIGASLPGATVGAGPVAAICAALVAVGVPVFSWWLWSGELPIERPLRRALVVAGLALALGVGLASAAGRPPPWPVRPELTVVDVGQGDAILLRSPEGGAALIDTGPDGGPAPVVDALARRGVRHLDLVAVTHDQADHAGGVGQVLDRFRVDTLIAPRTRTVAEGLSRRLRRPVVGVSAGDRLRIGQWQLRVLWPSSDAPGSDPNDTALVMIAEADGLRALLCADAEGTVIAHLPIGHVDVLKVAHHGSSDPALAALVAQLTPAAAAISVGRANGFGHPTSATLRALSAAGVPVWRTDRGGSITFQRIDGALRVSR